MERATTESSTPLGEDCRDRPTTEASFSRGSRGHYGRDDHLATWKVTSYAIAEKDSGGIGMFHCSELRTPDS